MSVVVEKLIVIHPVRKFPAFFWFWRFSTVFTRICYWSLFWARSIQHIHTQTHTRMCASHPISIRSILMLSSHPRIGLQSGLFFSGLPTRIFYAFLVTHACYMCHLSQPSWVDHPNNILLFPRRWGYSVLWEQNKLLDFLYITSFIPCFTLCYSVSNFFEPTCFQTLAVYVLLSK